MRELTKIMKNWSSYREWKRTVSGKMKHYVIMGVGYYLPSFNKKNGIEKEFDMKSGKKSVLKLADYEMFTDPNDMVKSSKWQFNGYVGEKKLTEMTFDEYLQFLSPSNIEKK